MEPISSERIVLREFRADDLDDYFAICGDDRVTVWMAFDSYDRAKAIETLNGIIERSARADRPDYMLAVARRDDDRVIGLVRIAPGVHRNGKLACAIGAEHWKHGYATEATQLLLDFSFGTLGLHRVTAAIGPENEASIAVVKRLGFSYEGHLRDHVFTNGAWRDSVLYSLLEDEYADRSPEGHLQP
ncbi:GNAT family N-acetyltransferase [Kribbella sandramycini]|uniref:GNAT family N-acetyltransferase n=1 Tax=Kribbella sandramycini TaxID=60450 RepID=A0A7Y4L093_9ACTN|nr:GNAT family protein [Kribbella sandramycini]MBB6565646.1 RimJ/RimL family protein N-acetyltransferase [Kribbella sandramycini]NOL41909.1 GNAT family N-acetyltransferase [Kribbella sandramycini]